MKKAVLALATIGLLAAACKIPEMGSADTSPSPLWDRVYDVNQSMTVDGLTVTVLRAAIGDPARLWSELPTSDWEGAKAAVAFKLRLTNNTGETIAIYPGFDSIAAMNGEQSETDFWLNDDIDGDILGGFSVEGALIAPSMRYVPGAITSIRLVFDGPNWDSESFDFRVDLGSAAQGAD